MQKALFNFICNDETSSIPAVTTNYFWSIVIMIVHV